MPIRSLGATLTIATLALLFASACGGGPSAVEVAPRGGVAPPPPAPPPPVTLADEVEQLRGQAVVFDPSTEVGTLPGRSGVTPTGQAVYSIPLDVAPGVGSMTPELSLEYRSTTQDGPLGVGFSLGGIAPPIRRCNRSLALDGTNGPFEFEQADPLCWGDERLVLVAGVHGLDGAEYRTRRDPFAKIVQHADTHARDSYFEIFTKDGRILTLGQSGAMLFHEIDGDPVPWVWALRHTEDRFGNGIEYRYHAPKPARGLRCVYVAARRDRLRGQGLGGEPTTRSLRLCRSHRCLVGLRGGRGAGSHRAARDDHRRGALRAGDRDLRAELRCRPALRPQPDRMGQEVRYRGCMPAPDHVRVERSGRGCGFALDELRPVRRVPRARRRTRRRSGAVRQLAHAAGRRLRRRLRSRPALLHRRGLEDLGRHLAVRPARHAGRRVVAHGAARGRRVRGGAHRGRSGRGPGRGARRRGTHRRGGAGPRRCRRCGAPRPAPAGVLDHGDRGQRRSTR